MNIEQVKAEAKKQFDKDLTDEQARALLDPPPRRAFRGGAEPSDWRLYVTGQTAQETGRLGKAEAKKRFDRDLTDEQAQAFLEAHPAGELSEEELSQVTGGYRTPTASRGKR